MNERIKQLVSQAGGHFSTHNLMSNPVQHRESIELWDDRIEKFAHLLMREIMRVQVSYQTGMDLENKKMDNPARELTRAVIEHFGVEE